MNSDYQRVVEYLRDLRQGPLQAVTDEIAQAATEYAALCVEANERLRKCSTFLQQGLRTEAIHLAEDTPNLLDLVAALDLPDSATWSEFCQNNGLAVPPPLQMDRASQLNDAYALDQPMEHLLSRHRLLALSRAPVRQRLEVLRQIAQVDAANGSWEKDIRVFERARLKELPTAFYNGVKNKDEQVIGDLMNELHQTWFESVPEDLSIAVGDAFHRMQRAGCEAELTKLIEPLRDAFAARSLKECQALVGRWRKVMTAASVTRLSRHLEEEIKPVVAYVTEQEKREEYVKRFNDSCKAFGQLLDRDADDAQLEAGYARLVEFKEPIPDELTERFAQKNQLRQRATERRHKVRLVSIGATVTGLVAMLLVAGILLMRGYTARSWAGKIQDANNVRNLAVAQKYIAQLQKDHPSFLTDAQVAQAVAQTAALQTQHDKDAALLNDLVQQIEAAGQNAAPVLAAPDAATDRLLASAVDVQQVLDLAQKDGDLGWVDADKRLANGLIKLNGLATRLRATASAAIKAQVDKDSAAVDALQASPGAVAGAFAQLQQLADRLNGFKSAVGIDDDTRAAVVELAARVEQRKASLETAQSVAAALDNIRQMALSADELKKALAAFVQRFPNDPRTAEFTRAIRSLPGARALEAWRGVVSAWGGQFVPPTEDAARKRLDAITGYLAASPDSPMSPAVTIYQDYVHRAADALAEKGVWQTDFNKILTHPLMSELAYMETSDHHRFFVLGDLNRKTRSINNQVSVTFDAIDPTDPTYAKRINVAVDAPTTVSETPIPAAHTKLIVELVDAVKRVNESNWDTWGIDLIERLRSNDDLDLVVRATLIQQAIKTEQTVAGWALGDTYTRSLGELARQKPEELSLINPLRAGTRDALADIIKAIPQGLAVKAKIGGESRALFRLLAFEVAATGVALKDDAGQWTVFAHSTFPNGDVLWTVAPGAAASAAVAPPAAPPPAPATAAAPETPAAPPPPAPNAATLLQIGIVTDGKYLLNENALHNVPQGSIVYVTKP